MDFSDFIFCILDILVEGLILFWAIRSRKVIVEAKSKSKLFLSIMFFVVAAISFYNYEGLAKWVQCISLLAIGVTFMFVKSGVSIDGIIVTGVEITWQQAGEATINYTDNTLAFENKKRPYRLYFEADDIKEVRDILKKVGKKK